MIVVLQSKDVLLRSVSPLGAMSWHCILSNTIMSITNRRTLALSANKDEITLPCFDSVTAWCVRTQAVERV